MALYVDCDWCGETVGGDCVELTCFNFDHRAEFQYHPECVREAIELLRLRSRQAQRGDESGLEWRLVPTRKPDEWASRGGLPREEIEALCEERKQREATGTPLRELGLDDQTHSILRWRNGDVVTIEELIELSEDELSAFRGVGQKRIREIKQALGRRGLALKRAVA